jgi:hypothetical protein
MAFSLKEYDIILGKQIFYELLKDGKSLLAEFVDEIQSNPQYKSEYLTLLSYMEMVAKNERTSPGKYKPLNKNKDGYNEYEFRSDHLRIYLFHLSPYGKIIILGGYKNQQPEDIKKFRSLKKQYLTSLNL